MLFAMKRTELYFSAALQCTFTHSTRLATWFSSSCLWLRPYFLYSSVWPSPSKPSSRNKTCSLASLVWWRQPPWIQQHGCGVFPLWITHPHTPTLTNTASPKTQMGEELISDLISPGFGGDTVFFFFNVSLTDRTVVLLALLSMCAFM